jgi:hypothetical protein
LLKKLNIVYGSETLDQTLEWEFLVLVEAVKRFQICFVAGEIIAFNEDLEYS